MNSDDEQPSAASRDPLTATVIGCAYDVANGLGHGFLEKVYENALTLRLKKAGLEAVQQHSMAVHFDGVVVGEFAADIVVYGELIIELKCARELSEAHVAQCLNYLKATGIKTCLLVNFGKPRIEIRRLSL